MEFFTSDSIPGKPSTEAAVPTGAAMVLKHVSADSGSGEATWGCWGDAASPRAGYAGVTLWVKKENRKERVGEEGCETWLCALLGCKGSKWEVLGARCSRAVLRGVLWAQNCTAGTIDAIGASVWLEDSRVLGASSALWLSPNPLGPLFRRVRCAGEPLLLQLVPCIPGPL